MTVNQGVADADTDLAAAAEMLEAVKEALFRIDPTHVLVEKRYPEVERWVFGWLVEPEVPTENRRTFIELHASQIAIGATHVLGRGRRIQLTAVCTRDGRGSVDFQVKPLPVNPPPPGGYEALGQQLLQEVINRLLQLENAPAVFANVPEGLEAAWDGRPFYISSTPEGIAECVSNMRDSLEPGLSFCLRLTVLANGHFRIEAFRLGPAQANQETH
jgi:hypothetical protein